MPGRVESAGWEFLAAFGSAFAALRASRDGEDQRLAELLWRQMPLAKALVDLAIREPQAFDPLWKAHQKEAMPFGEPPIEPEPLKPLRMETFAVPTYAPSVLLQRACDELHTGVGGASYFTSVIALGTFDALNMSTGAQRPQVACAAQLNRDRPDATAALVQRLRQIVEDLDRLVKVTGQEKS